MALTDPIIHNAPWPFRRWSDSRAARAAVISHASGRPTASFLVVSHQTHDDATPSNVGVNSPPPEPRQQRQLKCFFSPTDADQFSTPRCVAGAKVKTGEQGGGGFHERFGRRAVVALRPQAHQAPAAEGGERGCGRRGLACSHRRRGGRAGRAWQMLLATTSNASETLVS